MFIQYLFLFVCLIDGFNSCRYSIDPKKFVAKRRQELRMKSVMEANDIVPDVVDTVPNKLIQIRYPSGVNVNLGNELTPLSVKDEPTVDWTAEAGAYYTLIMTDPDVPSKTNQTLGQVKHWLVVNIPGSQVRKGESLAAYRGSGPPLGSGLHRYIFLVYKQNGLIKHMETVLPTPARDGRLGFKTRDFAKKYNLGEPVAANFYLAQYDDYVGQRNREQTPK